jgi:hypothetical protein
MKEEGCQNFSPLLILAMGNCFDCYLFFNNGIH